ncbi:autoinducer 2 ABC transporter substrate-binding protein [Telmatospirillum sp.]|uniref:autoinducer 2 ABC transporter substrate-binding protein n=1 Tax=Telmatospirillum sp. TaxID=2079197 RepID=UPI00283E09DD|nr:autoinducer 2 ABC transporter substrate-binding protein [Telmatospirillum sp.]MDR3440285.1 autoinducer 2 ABC transporter substrate-binding protein [Telmatospirillum sp.]
MKNKLFAALGAGLLMAGLAITPSLVEAKDSGFKIMMTPKWTGFPYFELTGEGAKAAAKELGDELIYAGADHAEASLQVETLQNFVTQKPDGIILSAIDLNAVAPVLKNARKKGIAVATYDADAAVPARDMFVNQLSYEQAARVMLDCALIDVPEGGEIAFIAASPTSPNHMAHIKIMTNLTQTEDKYKVFKVVDTQFANDDDAKSYDVAVNLMQAHPNLKVIISSSAVSAPAAARAIEASGHVGKVYATGFALPSAIKRYLENGSEKAFAFWDPWELGYVTAYALHEKMAGKFQPTEGAVLTVEKVGTFKTAKDGEVVYGKPLIFTKDTVEKYKF